MVALIPGAGYRIELVDAIAHSPGANGTTSSNDPLVQIATSGRSAAAICKTLAHELAHVLLHATALLNRPGFTGGFWALISHATLG